MTDAQWAVVEMDASQVQETRRLFQRVFGHPLSEALWRWKYDDGRGVAVGARAPDGELLAHYGGTLRQVFFFNHAAIAVQIGDVMVAQEGRAALAHKGPFGMVVQAFLARHVGVANGAVLGFGFPNARHMRLGEKLGHYAQVDKVSELSWKVLGPFGDTDRNRLKPRVERLDWADPATTGQLNALWNRMKGDLKGMVVPGRDASWWRHRYANHPEHRYVCFWVRSFWSRRVVGAFVLRAHPEVGASAGTLAQTWELMDWVAPLNKGDAVLEAALAIVGSHGGRRLMGWFSGTASSVFSTPAATSNDACTAGVTSPGELGVFQVGENFSPSVEELRGKWWLTGGDTDFR